MVFSNTPTVRQNEPITIAILTLIGAIVAAGGTIAAAAISAKSQRDNARIQEQIAKTAATTSQITSQQKTESDNKNVLYLVGGTLVAAYLLTK